MISSGKQITVSQRRAWGIVGLFLISLAMNLVGLFRSNNAVDIPEAGPETLTVLQWSTWMEYCKVVANGPRFWTYRDRYKLAGGCYIWDGLGSWLDAPQLQLSKAYDIEKTEIPTLVKWSPSFKKELLAKSPASLMINYVLLMVPLGIDVGSFSTLRQAKGMGVRIVFMGTSGENFLYLEQ
jgi:hypothetical protein